MDNNQDSVKEKEAEKQPEKSEAKVEPIVPPAVPKPADADPPSIAAPPETPSLAALIGDVKIAYEKKIADITSANAKAIKERDDLIKQLAAGDEPKKQSSIVDDINSRRNWKKW